MFHLIIYIGRSDLRTFARNFFGHTCLGVPAVASFRKKKGKHFFPKQAPDDFWPF